MLSKRKRPPLRTKTGCTRCRISRRKCDEKKPACTICSRNGLPCHYGSTEDPTEDPLHKLVQAAKNRQGLSDSVVTRAAVKNKMHATSNKFRNQSHFDLAMAYAPILEGSVKSPKPFTGILPTIMNLALQYPALSNAMAALASDVMSNTTGQIAFYHACRESYQDAVIHLRKSHTINRTFQDNLTLHFTSHTLGILEVCSLLWKQLLLN